MSRPTNLPRAYEELPAAQMAERIRARMPIVAGSLFVWGGNRTGRPGDEAWPLRSVAARSDALLLEIDRADGALAFSLEVIEPRGLALSETGVLEIRDARRIVEPDRVLEVRAGTVWSTLSGGVAHALWAAEGQPAVTLR